MFLGAGTSLSPQLKYRNRIATDSPCREFPAMTAASPGTAMTIKAPSSEAAKDLWNPLIFAAKTFVAGLLALYVAFWLGLDEPRWALLTVYIVSQPESGLVLAKGFYRALGTAAGLLVTTLLVFTFAQYGE